MRVVLCSAWKCSSVIAHFQGNSVTFLTGGLGPCLAQSVSCSSEWRTGLHLRISALSTGLYLRISALRGGWGSRYKVSFRIHAPHPQIPPHLEQNCCRFRGGKAVLGGGIKIQHHYHRLALQTGLLLFSFVSLSHAWPWDVLPAT